MLRPVIPVSIAAVEVLEAMEAIKAMEVRYHSRFCVRVGHETIDIIICQSLSVCVSKRYLLPQFWSDLTFKGTYGFLRPKQR